MWKKFSFYTAELLQSADPGSPLYSIQALDITTITSGRGNLIFGDSEGGITICDEDFALRRFSAYEENVNFAYQYKQSNMLLTIGDGTDYRDGESVSVSRNLVTRFRSNLNSNETYKWMLEDLHIPPTLSASLSAEDATMKVWLLDKMDEHGQPLCLRSIPLFEKMDEETITTLAVDESAQFIVFGCSSGHVYYLHGDLLRLKKIVPTALPAQYTSSITSLHIVPSLSNPNHLSLFVTSESKIGCYEILLENKKQIQFTPLEDKGCRSNCSCLDAKNRLVMGRDEGLYVYSTKRRVSTCILPQPKTLVASYRDCIVVGNSCQNQNQSVLTFYNINNTCEVFTMDVVRNGNSEDVRFLFSEWNTCFIMTEGHIVYLLREKDIQTKLNLLYERGVFTTALSLSHDWNLSEKEISAIHRAYANSLYEKKEYDRAIQEYIATIGNVDASHVIRQFLDASLIHQLVLYLEELHRHQIATSDHTLLLMNCYIKLHDNDKLQAFVYEKALGTHYNPSTAINALASSGYSKEALFLAKENHLYEQYLSIQIEKAGAFEDAMNYINSLTLKEAEKAFIRYGKLLVDSVSEAATDLAIRLSTSGEKLASNPEQFIHCFADKSVELKRFLQAVTTSRTHCDPTIWNTLLELFLRDPPESPDYNSNIMGLLTNPKACYDNDEALILLQNGHCDEGLVYIYKKLHMNMILLRLYVDLKRYDEAIQLCKEEGKKDHSIWMSLLAHFAKREQVEEEDLKKVVTAVELSGVVSLFEIIHTLVDNPSVPAPFIRDLVMKQLAREKTIRESDILKSAKIQGEIDQLKQSMDRYQNHVHCFKQTRCIGCGLPLELPTVHFLCGHSYHKACVDLEGEHCPKCEVTRKEKVKVDESLLLSELQESRDGFAFVADCFGKDLFQEEEDSEPEPESEAVEPVQEEEFDEDSIPMQTLDI